MNSTRNQKRIKCVVWDLDGTIWHGTLLENDEVVLRDGVAVTLAILDKRGILHSIASKNDERAAFNKLSQFNLSQYFLHPQIGWNPKSKSIATIAKRLNINVDTIAFVDDQSYEREEVRFALPEVLCLESDQIRQMINLPALIPRLITDESKYRRAMYWSEIRRKEAETNFSGPNETFLATLGMELSVYPATLEDLQRAEELTVRTNQLNTTGYTYSFEELENFLQSPEHLLLIANLDDKYGKYGKIGLALIEMSADLWTIKLLLMSCRVISRGIGTVFINNIRKQAQKKGVLLRAEFLHTDVNRMMYVTYKFTHFYERTNDGSFILLENDLSQTIEDPSYLKRLEFRID